MQNHRNPTSTPDGLVEGLARTRYTLVACVACGRARIHAPRPETCCPQRGGSGRRSFAMFRDLRQEQR